MSIFVALARLVLILIFFVAGITKLSQPAGLRQTYASLGLPQPLRAPAVLGLPLAELAVACLLPWSVTAVPGAILASLLALLFAGTVVFALTTKRTVPCSCFGNFGSGALGKATLVRDLGVLALSGVTLEALVHQPELRQWSSPVHWGQLSISTWLAIFFAGLTVLVAASAGWLITTLVRQNARLLRRLASDTPAVRYDVLDATPIGSLAPSLSIVGSGPGNVSAVLAEFRTLLIFVDQACRTCVDLSPEIASWQKSLASAGNLTMRRAQILVFVEAAKTAHGHALFESVSAHHDVDSQVAARYGVTATPVALIVDQQERVASQKAFGPDEIRHLYSHFWESVMQPDAVELESAHGH